MASYMEPELPKRLYGEGLEPQIKKIKNNCRMSLLGKLKKAMKEDYGEVLRDVVFTHVMAIAENKLKFSAKLVHSFLCKELVTSKIHEKWFIFARTPLRFSMQEYHAITGLKYTKEVGSEAISWKEDSGFWSEVLKKNRKITLKSIMKGILKEVHKWSRIDRLRLIYLCVVMGVVMGRDEKAIIPCKYIMLALDLEKFQNYHCGLVSFDFLLSSITKTREKLENKESYILEGFSFALQIWVMEAILDFGEICGKRVSDSFTGPRCANWIGSTNVSYEDIIQLEKSFPDKGGLFSFISASGNDVVFSFENQRKGEMEDERVDHILERIKNIFDWSNTEWVALEADKSVMEPAVQETGEAEDAATVDDSGNGRSSVVGEVLGSCKRKILDEGAQSIKKKVLCERVAAKVGTSKAGSLDDETNSFIEGLFNTAFTSFAETLSTQMLDRMEKMETHVLDMMDKMEAEVAQLRESKKQDSEAVPLSGHVTGPSTRKVQKPAAKKKITH